jgi:hypothetical protein
VKVSGKVECSIFSSFQALTHKKAQREVFVFVLKIDAQEVDREKCISPELYIRMPKKLLCSWNISEERESKTRWKAFSIVTSYHWKARRRKDDCDFSVAVEQRSVLVEFKTFKRSVELSEKTCSLHENCNECLNNIKTSLKKLFRK